MGHAHTHTRVCGRHGCRHSLDSPFVCVCVSVIPGSGSKGEVMVGGGLSVVFGQVAHVDVGEEVTGGDTACSLVQVTGADLPGNPARHERGPMRTKGSAA